MATEPKAAAAAPTYFVAKGVLVQRDPKTKKKTNIIVGTEYKPSDEEELASLPASGAIVTAEEYAAMVASPMAQEVIAAERARADALQKEVDELKAKQAPAK